MTGVVGPAVVSSVAGESDEVGSFRVEPRQGRIPMICPVADGQAAEGVAARDQYDA